MLLNFIGAISLIYFTLDEILYNYLIKSCKRILNNAEINLATIASTSIRDDFFYRR